jgi:hypothetical protein
MAKVQEENLLTIGTLNLSIEAVKRRPKLLEQQVKDLMRECDILLIQEAGAAKTLLARIKNYFNNDPEPTGLVAELLARVAEDIDVTLFHGNNVGAPSDPIMYRSDLDVRDTNSFPLTPRRWQGKPGAGASEYSKPKYLNAISFKFRTRYITASSIHVTPSQYIPVRYRLASEQVNDSAVALSGLKGLKLIGGDWNAVPGNRLFAPLLNVGFKSAQAIFGPFPTHFGGKKGRAIDDIYFLESPSRWRVVSAEARDTTSDHHVFIVVIEVFPKR